MMKRRWKDKVWWAYYNHLAKARRRGIPFEFTFEEWVNWWEDHLGGNWFKKRGSHKGQYVMARFNDAGPYTPKNVKCILCTENASEGGWRVRRAVWLREPIDGCLMKHIPHTEAPAKRWP